MERSRPTCYAPGNSMIVAVVLGALGVSVLAHVAPLEAHRRSCGYPFARARRAMDMRPQAIEPTLPDRVIDSLNAKAPMRRWRSKS